MTTTHVPQDDERTPGAATRYRLLRPLAPAAGLRREPRRLPWVLGSVGCALWAAGFPLVSTLGPQRAWGAIAAVGYVLAACAAAFLPRRQIARAVTGLSLAGAVVVPLALMVTKGWSQSEVHVVQNSAVQLLNTGSPYLPNPHQVIGYNPYLPVMALFGIPRALLGQAWWLPRVAGDPRIWFTVAFTGCLVATWQLLRPVRADGPSPDLPLPAFVRSWGIPSWGVSLAAVTASPLVALGASTGGVDLPLIGCCCLGLAFAGRGYAVRAGIVLALACAIKWTAWPALPVAALLLFQVHGSRAALRCSAATLALAAALIAPCVILTRQAVVEQVIRFPLGLSSVRTPADSPLPGHLLAELGQGGRIASFALLALGGVLVTLWLVIRPPRGVIAAADRLAAGVSVAFLLAPAGRFGYLALPILLVLWPRLATYVQAGAAQGSGMVAMPPAPVRVAER